jgi:hypothetical protein
MREASDTDALQNSAVIVGRFCETPRCSFRCPQRSSATGLNSCAEDSARYRLRAVR